MAQQDANLVRKILVSADSNDWGDRIALRQGEQAVTYSELGVLLAKTASALRKLGAKKGERVAIYSPDCMDAAVAMLGAMYAGAVALPVSELSAATDLRDRLNDAGASIVLVHESLRASAHEIRAELSTVQQMLTLGEEREDGLGRLVAKAKSEFKNKAVSPKDAAILVYSAGASTENNSGGLRGVLHCHAAPIRAFESFAKEFLGLTHEDRVFSTVRLSTVYGLGTGLLFPLLAGAETLLMPEQPHSSSIFESIKEFKPTIFSATPAVYGQLARDASRSGNTKILSGLRWCIAGAEGMPPKVIAMVRGVLGSNVAVGYGLTEAFQFVMASAAEGQRPGNCGKVLNGFEVRIVDEDGKTVGEDEIGTLHIRGEHIVDGYWGRDTKLTEDGWFTTVDRFMVDADQTYYHCGRVDHLFKVGGKWVVPSEVEAVLLANEAVWECAVIGADDEDGLIKPFAFIVANLGQVPGDKLEAELREYVKSELAPYKYPRWIEFVDELPKGQGGVILRYKLRDQLKHSSGRRRAETRAGKVD